MLSTLRILFLGLVLGLPQWALASTQEPLQLLKDTQKKLKAILDRKIPKEDKKAREARDNEIKSLFRPFFDFKKLAKKALQTHWDKLKPEQHSEYLFWLEALLENVSSQNINPEEEENADEPQIQYKKQTFQDNNTKATVFTEVRVPRKKKKGSTQKRWRKINVDWLFYRNNNKWMVEDLITNEESLAENYREQFDKIISKHSFAELIKRLQKQVNKLRDKDGLPALSYTPKTSSPE
ncbi:ABC transporter substrate-binding protein [Myxococcota bacterium]|nr:ABC transporter substrate-binding protein [Myxococcota bacterium]